MENQKFFTFINKFRHSEEFAARMVVAIFSSKSIDKLVKSLNNVQMETG
jgi:hypothetical protein